MTSNKKMLASFLENAENGGSEGAVFFLGVVVHILSPRALGAQ